MPGYIKVLISVLVIFIVNVIRNNWNKLTRNVFDIPSDIEDLTFKLGMCILLAAWIVRDGW